MLKKIRALVFIVISFLFMFLVVDCSGGQVNNFEVSSNEN